MKKKDIIFLILGTALCMLFLVGYYTGYPALWFFHGTMSKVRIQTISNLTNCVIYCALTTILGFAAGYFKNHKSALVKYGLVALLVMVLSLFGEYIGRRSSENFTVSFLEVLTDGLLYPFVSGFTHIYVLTLLLGMPLSSLPYKHKNLWNSLILGVVLLVFTFIFHRSSSGMEIYYYMSVAFGEAFFASFVLYGENAVLSPSILIGICGLSYLPILCYTTIGMPNISVFIVSIVYLITGSIFLGMTISKEISQNDEKMNENI